MQHGAEWAFCSNKQASVLPIEELNILLLDTHRSFFPSKAVIVRVSHYRSDTREKAPEQKKNFAKWKIPPSWMQNPLEA